MHYLHILPPHTKLRPARKFACEDQADIQEPDKEEPSSIKNLTQQWTFCAVAYDGTASVGNAQVCLVGTNNAVDLLGPAASLNQG